MAKQPKYLIPAGELTAIACRLDAIEQRLAAMEFAGATKAQCLVHGLESALKANVSERHIAFHRDELLKYIHELAGVS